MWTGSECKHISRLLWGYADGVLAAEQAARVDGHLKNCSSCRTLAADYAQTVTRINAYRAQSIPAAAPAWQQVRQHLEAKHNAPVVFPPYLLRRNRHWPAVAGVGIGAALLLGGTALRHREDTYGHLLLPASPNNRIIVRTAQNQSAATGSALQTNALSAASVKAAARRSNIASVGRVPAHGRTPFVSERITSTGKPKARVEPTLVILPLVLPEQNGLAYINADAIRIATAWGAMPAGKIAALEQEVDRTLRSGNDFLSIPVPPIAGRGKRGMIAALAAYRAEKEIVDPRLSQKVTLAAKAMPFADFCRQLRQKTGIELKAGRSVADEKVTLFCEDCALHDVMRQITHVFGFTWRRLGDEDRFRYELAQELRAQLAEEELRNQDVNAAIASLGDAMEVYRPHVGKTLAQLKQEAEKANGQEARLLWKMAGPELAGVQVYNNLSAEQRSELFKGQPLTFSPESQNPALRLPQAWSQNILAASGIRITDANTHGTYLYFEAANGRREDRGVGTPVQDWPSAFPAVTLKLDRPEIGHINLKVSIQIYANSTIMGDSSEILAEGQSPSVAKIDNATANKALRSLPAFKRHITVAPKHTCETMSAQQKDNNTRNEEHANVKSVPDIPFAETGETKGSAVPHLTSADVWEALHQQTGLPVIADCYTHLYPVQALTLREMPAFDALCRLCDTMKVRWKKDGAFVQGRSGSYFWDKLKEVPDSSLERWKQDSFQNNGLPLRDLLEMASCSDNQLEAQEVAEGIVKCRGVSEWGLVTDVGFMSIRSFARDLAALSSEELQRATSPQGLLLSSLEPAVRQEFGTQVMQHTGFAPEHLAGLRIRVAFTPAGAYVWNPPALPKSLSKETENWPLITDKSAQKTLAEAQKIYAQATMQEIRRSNGVLAIQFLPQDEYLKKFNWGFTLGTPSRYFTPDN